MNKIFRHIHKNVQSENNVINTVESHVKDNQMQHIDYLNNTQRNNFMSTYN